MTIDSGDENFYANIQQEFKILAELKMIQKENIGGVYVVPSSESSFLWFGVIFVREGFYSDGIFRFNISLPKDFPTTTETPTVIFQSELFHPLICPYTGITNLSDTFPTWNAVENHLWQLIKYIQFIFHHPIPAINSETIKISNKDATDLLRQQKIDEFVEKVKKCVELSKERVYDEPPTEDKHFIKFSAFDDELHRSTLESMKSKVDPSSVSPPPTGLSWVNESEFKPLSK